MAHNNPKKNMKIQQMLISRNWLMAATVATARLACPQASAAVILPDLTEGGTSFSSGGNAFTGDSTDVQAFDNNADTKAGFNTTFPLILGYTFVDSTTHTVESYSMTSANDSPNRDPRSFTLEGSNDGQFGTFTVLDTRSGVEFTDRFETQFFTVQNPGQFSTYRLVTTEAFDSTSQFQIAEVQLFAIPEPASLSLLAASGLLLFGRRRR